MPLCPTPGDLYNESRKPNSSSAYEVLRNSNGPSTPDADINVNRQTQLDSETQQNIINDIHGELGNYAAPHIDPNNIDQGSRYVANKIIKWWQDSVKGYEKKNVEDWNTALQSATGATSAVHSRWLGICSTLDKAFKNARAPLNHWAAIFSSNPDRPLQNNDIVRSANLAQSRTHGILTEFTNLFFGQDTMNIVSPIKKRLGYSDNECCIILGEAANLRSVESRNDILLKEWAREIKEIEAQDPLKRDYSNLESLINKRENLLLNLDNELIDPDITGPIYSCGYTNGEARARMREIQNLGFTEAEINAFSDRMEYISDYITKSLIDNGFIHPNQIAAFRGIQHHVPFQTKKNNNNGVINDTRTYHPGKFYEMAGSTGVRPDSAFATLMSYARRAANEIGMRDFGMLMSATAQHHSNIGRESGLKIIEEKQMNRLRNSNDFALRHWVNALEEKGGLFVDSPVYNEKTKQNEVKRLFIYFDPNFKHEASGLTGVKLNEALIAAPKYNSGLTRFAANVNSKYGQLFTRVPFFSPINGIRDLVERSYHLSNIELYNENGNLVKGISIIPKYFANAPRAGIELYKNIRGIADPESVGYKYYNEYKNMGLKMDYTPGRDESIRTIADILEKRNKPKSFIEERLGNSEEFKNIKNLADNLGEKGKILLRTLDSWNDYFNNISSFNEYMCLREAGISQDIAANQVLLSMDLYQTGTTTPVLRALYPFIRPTVQSGAAMMRTLGFSYDPRGFYKAGRRGVAYMLGSYAALSSLLPLIKDVLGTDEKGNEKIDAIPFGTLTKSIPIGVGGGDFIKLPVGFGPVQLVMAMVFGQDRVERGRMTPEDLAAEIFFTGMKNMVPGNQPDYSFSQNPATWLTQMFSPTWARPVVELATNTTHFGAPIMREQHDKSLAKALSGRASTPLLYHKMAKEILQTTGIDLAPEQIRSLEENILAGPLRLLRYIYADDDLNVYKGGEEKNASERINPILKALGGGMIWSTVSNMDRSLFYNALNYYYNKIKRAGIRLKDSSYGNDKGKRIEYQSRILSQKGFTDEEIEDILLLESIKGDIGKLNSTVSRNTRDLWSNAESAEDLKDIFSALSSQEAELYKEAVNAINFYKR